jgi:hypothetical protein
MSDQCHKCGAYIITEGATIVPTYRCGTIDKGEKTDQSLHCRIRELEEQCRLANAAMNAMSEFGFKQISEAVKHIERLQTSNAELLAALEAAIPYTTLGAVEAVQAAIKREKEKAG